MPIFILLYVISMVITYWLSRLLVIKTFPTLPWKIKDRNFMLFMSLFSFITLLFTFLCYLSYRENSDKPSNW